MSFQWPRSDGDPSRWPATGQHSGEKTWWQELASTDKKYGLYEGRIGEHLIAKGFKVSGRTVKLPTNYRIFVHFQPREGGEIREDMYVFGSTNVHKFRSVPEILPHIDWLLDETKPLTDHSTCECKYSKGGQGHGAGAGKPRKSLTGGSGLGPSKRAGPSSSNGKTKRQRVSTGEGSDSGQDAIPEDRRLDLETGRRFRRGELVWMRIQTFEPPSGSNLPPITHWPALVSSITPRSKVLPPEGGSSGIHDAAASISAAWSIGGGAAPDTLKKEQKIIKWWEYSLRPLGFFSSSDLMVKDTRDLLPYQVGKELVGGDEGWAALGHQAEQVMRREIDKEIEEEKAKPEAERGTETVERKWRRRWGDRILLQNVKEWETAIVRFGFAIKVAMSILNCWAQTDRIEVLDGTDINEEDLKAIQSQLKTLYQGVWWGGERIWLGDVVRIKKHRDELPTDALLPPSEGARERGVFLCVRLITIEISDAPQAQQGETAWRCLLYGDILELVDGDEAWKPKIEMDGTGNSEAQLVSEYRAVKGHMFKQINDEGSEATCDIIDVAGRIYPDLLDPTTQTWYAELDTPEEKLQGRHLPGDYALSLVGLKNGLITGSTSERWKEDLYTIVDESSRIAERDCRKYYAQQLRDGGVVLKPSKVNEADQEKPSGYRVRLDELPLVANANGNGHGHVHGHGNANGHGNGYGNDPATLAAAATAPIGQLSFTADRSEGMMAHPGPAALTPVTATGH